MNIKQPSASPPASPTVLACGLQDAAIASGVSVRKLSADIATGRLASIKLGRRRLVLVADLEAYLRAGRSPAAATPAVSDQAAHDGAHGDSSTATAATRLKAAG